MIKEDPFQIVLDHNHVSWMVRATLCRTCNQLEGKMTIAFIRYVAKKKNIDYVTFLKGLINFSKIKDTKYRYPEKPKRKKKKR